MKIKLLAAVMLLASMFAGCVNQDTYIGTYKLDKIPSKTLEIREDGTYLLVPADPKFTEKGVYVKRGSTIELTGALGITNVMNITDYGFLDADGDKWIRVKQK